MLLLGVQGCGKSLAAKAAAGIFGVPLLRLDFGVLYNKYYGETERNLRKALETAEVMSPCVLWMDEIEKGVAGSSGDDDGLSRRVLGTLLTWMSERKQPVFLVATANDITRLPPEFVRKGRFDEIFFVDLPSAAEPSRHSGDSSAQAEPRPPKTFDLDALIEATDGFSGSEIEQAIVSAMYTAHAQGRTLSQDDLLAEIEADAAAVGGDGGESGGDPRLGLEPHGAVRLIYDLRLMIYDLLRRAERPFQIINRKS